MTSEPARLQWPSSAPPPADGGWQWQLSHVSELPSVRAELRAGLAAAAVPHDLVAAELDEAVVLAFDEMASNALRHGGGSVEATVRLTRDSYLLEVSDSASTAPPVPAVGRDPSEGGLGLYLIAELSTHHGWYVSDGHKHVWAVLPLR